MKQVKFEQLLIDVLSQQSHSKETKEFRRWITTYIKRNIENIMLDVHDGNVYVTKGKAEIYPCIVCHTDTVHAINRNVEVYKTKDELFAFDNKKMRQYGIGGDDKVGVFMCLMMLHELPYIKCAFFRDEEIGCIGSGRALVNFFDDCSMVLQCDRRGSNDFITNICNNEMSSDEFQETIKPITKSHGYEFEDGAWTDVDKLKDKGINLCMANMSCGYYEPHTNYEYVNIIDVANCFFMCKEIFIKHGDSQWVHIRPEKKSWSGYYQTDWNWASDWGYDYTKGNSKVEPFSKSGTRCTEYQDGKILKKEFNDGSIWEFSKDEGWKMTTPPQIIQTNVFDKQLKAIPIATKACPNCMSYADLSWDEHELDYFCNTCGDYVDNLTRIIYNKTNDSIK